MNLTGPRYRIQTVARMTGVPATTLRSWERRYGVPAPNRTDSGYRLYTDFDIAQIRRMQALQAEGISASEAAELVRELPKSFVVGASGVPPEVNTALIQELVGAIEQFDGQRLQERIQSSLRDQAPHLAYRRVISPALHRVGDLWRAGKLSVAQEHLFSHIIEGALRGALERIQPPNTSGRVILACIAEEQHVLGIYGVALHVAAWRYQPSLLGACTPPAALHHAVENLRPLVVGLSATIARPPADALRLFKAYAEACGTTPWGVGGEGATAMADVIASCGGAVCEPDLSWLHELLGR